MNSQHHRLMRSVSIAALLASIGLAGCNKQDSLDAKNAAGDGVVRVEQKARELGQDAKMASRSAGDKVTDAVITTSVKAELAKDPNLSALKIDVDTDNGRVVLHGSAPSSDARAHATALAAAVKGVTRVDNQLAVEAGKS